MAFRIDEVVSRWIKSNSSNMLATSSTYDYEVHDWLKEARSKDLLEFVEALVNEELSEDALVNLGASVFEDYLTKFPEDADKLIALARVNEKAWNALEYTWLPDDLPETVAKNMDALVAEKHGKN